MKKTRRLPDVYSPLRAETELSFPVLETLVESEEEANGETSDETEGCSGVEIFDSSDTAEQGRKKGTDQTTATSIGDNNLGDSSTILTVGNLITQYRICNFLVPFLVL